MSKTHELKILPEHFWPVVIGHKKAELRKNDRDFKVGDTIILYEWNGDYTGERTERTIVHIADVGAYLPGYVLLSLNEIADWKDGVFSTLKMDRRLLLLMLIASRLLRNMMTQEYTGAITLVSRCEM